MLDSLQNAKAQQVKFDQSHPLAVVLIPLQHGAVVHPRVFNRHHFTNRPVGEHHATGMDTQVSGQGQSLPGKLHHRLGQCLGV
ncbi:MAG: Uncharacterised protein [Cellulomonadaceae bacterium TMED98]|nr:MAG: Uncharacterised protein [Cellulomonadaceae bacterium TMED98]